MGTAKFATLAVMATPGKIARPTRHSAALLTSRENRWLKEFRMALRAGVPTESHCVGVEGVRLVQEALRSTWRIKAVLFSESGHRHRQRLGALKDGLRSTFPVLYTTDRLFAGLADTEHPQGVAALVEPRLATLADVFGPAGEAAPALVVVLAGVQDPGNVGAILRTAAAFGATAAVTTASGQSRAANPFAPKALRASAGAALRLPILVGMSLPILLAQLRVAGVRTIAASSREQHESNAQPLLAPWELDWRGPVALLVGNEGAGLSEEIERSADARTRIPMASGVESLNAAAATAVLFYEAARQRTSLSAASAAKP